MSKLGAKEVKSDKEKIKAATMSTSKKLGLKTLWTHKDQLAYIFLTTIKFAGLKNLQGVSKRFDTYFLLDLRPS